MKITLSHLKKLWDDYRIKRIKQNQAFFVCSEKVLACKKRNIIKHIDAVWSDDHDGTVKKRNEFRRLKHMFVSQICDVAAEEYATVCKILKLKGIVLVAYNDEIKYLLRCQKLLHKHSIETNSFIISDKPRVRPYQVSKVC
jgi:hypothetical protein